MATITDKRLQVDNGSGAIANYTADVSSALEYYAFGSLMPGRATNATGYRYGFNGKENDNDAGKGTGNQQDYGMRIYDPRIGKFLSVDPLTAEYPELTPYQFASNTPIIAIDIDGLEGGISAMQAWYAIKDWWNNSNSTAGSIVYAQQMLTQGAADNTKQTNGTAFWWSIASGLKHYNEAMSGVYVPMEPITFARPKLTVPIEPLTESSVSNLTNKQTVAVNGGNEEAALVNVNAQKKLQVGPYEQMKKANASSNMSADHIPSFASLRKAAEARKGSNLTSVELKALRNQSLTLVYETDMHQQYSRTYGGRNKKLSNQDATDLLNAVKNDINKLKPELLKAGYSEEDIDAAYKQLSEKYTSLNKN